MTVHFMRRDAVRLASMEESSGLGSRVSLTPTGISGNWVRGGSGEGGGVNIIRRVKTVG
jgi:hypothetical protein